MVAEEDVAVAGNIVDAICVEMGRRGAGIVKLKHPAAEKTSVDEIGHAVAGKTEQSDENRAHWTAFCPHWPRQVNAGAHVVP